jgi:hypothetical protein
VGRAFSESGPIILDASTGDVRAVVVPFDIAESNWPFNVSFVVFMASAVNFLADDTGAGASGRTVQPGTVYADRLPPGSTNVTVKPPDADAQSVQATSDGRVVSWAGQPGPTDLPGTGGRPTRLFAANLFDPWESDVGSTEVLELASAVVEARDTGTANTTRRLWPWLLLAALLVMLLEWFVYNRKVHV